MKDNQARLELEKQNLVSLDQDCVQVHIDSDGDAPRNYKIELLVDSIADFDSGSNQLVSCDKHEIEMVLPMSFPQTPPEIRWLSSIFHPNVSISGYLDMQDIGLEWTPEMSLTVVCERLWDIARFAWVDSDSANNYSAQRKWNEGVFSAPTDARPLREKRSKQFENIVSYAPISPEAADVEVAEVTPVEIVNAEIVIADETDSSSSAIEREPDAADPRKSDVFVIDETVSKPPPSSAGKPNRESAGDGDEDILFID